MPKRSTPKPDLSLPLELQRSGGERILAVAVYSAAAAGLLYMTVKPWFDGTAGEDPASALIRTLLWIPLFFVLLGGAAWDLWRTDWLRTKYTLTNNHLTRATSRGVNESEPWDKLVWITSNFKYACFSGGGLVPLDEFWAVLPYSLKLRSRLADATLRNPGAHSRIAKLGHRLHEAESYRREMEQMSVTERVLFSLCLALTGIGFIVAMIAFGQTQNPSFASFHGASAALFFIGILGLILTMGLWALRINLQTRRELRWWKRAYGRP